MKTKKMLSFILSLGIMTSSFAGASAVKAAGSSSFTNLIENGDMEDAQNIKWEPSTSVTGAKITIEADTKDSSNHVLRFDGTGITDGIVSNANYNNIIKNGKTYYYSYKIRVAESDTNSGALYSSNSNLLQVNNLTRPKLTKENWATRSGVFTASKDNSFNFKISNAQDKTTGTANVAKVIYELDNVVVYEFDDMYELTLPENVTFAEGGKTLEFTNNATELRQIKKHYAKAGDIVKLEYKGVNGLGIEGTEVTADGNTYTFTMPSEATTVILTDPPAFTNLVENGDMEDAQNIKWEPSTSVTGAKITIETDTKDASNHVLRFDGTGISAGNVSTVTYKDVIKKDKTYYYSYKIRVAESDTNSGALYAYNSNLTAVNNLARPKITKENWVTRSGVFTAQSDNSFNFKISNAQDKTTNTANVPNVIYELDNVVVYDFTDIYEITLTEGVELAEGGKNLGYTNKDLSQGKKHYAKAGEKVKLEYTGAKILTVEGVEVTADGNIYTFTMPNAATTVVLTDPPAFTNLIENGDMEDAQNIKWEPSTSVTGAKITIETDTKDAENKVLRYDGTAITEGNVSSLIYKDVIKKDKTYYYSYKIRVAETDANEGKLYAYNSNFTGKNNLARPEVTKEKWATRSGVFTASADSSFNFKISKAQYETTGANNVPKVIYELDNVTIYVFTDIYEITLPENVTLTEGGKGLDVTNNATELRQIKKHYAKAGDIVKLEYAGKDTLTVEGAEVTADGNTYTFTMPASATTVTLIGAPAFTNIVENGDMEDTQNIKWKASSSVKDAEISIVADTNNSENKVLRYDGTSISAGSISFVSYSDLLEKGRRYYYSYKIRMAESDTNEGDLYAYNSNNPEVSDIERPKVSKEWITRSGVFTAVETYFSFKIISDQSTLKSDVANAVYEIDDVVIYEFANIYGISMPSNTTVETGESIRALDVTNEATETATGYFAIRGTEINLSYSGNKELEADVEMTTEGNTYSFIMPEYDVTVTEKKDITFGINEQAPVISVLKPMSFVVITAKYNESNELEDVYLANIETTENNQTVSLSEMIEFSGIGDWNGRRVFVWDNFTNMNPLSSVFTCEIQ